MWTLAMILFVAGYAVMKTLASLTTPIKKHVHPSEALIDQILPPEIMEQIFINLDYEALINSSEVNKYWRYLASDEKIRESVCSYFQRTDVQELLEHWKNRPDFELEKLNLLSYPKDNIEGHHQDQLWARRHGYKLINADLKSARYIRLFMNTEPDEVIRLWVVKLRCKMVSYNNEWWFGDSKIGLNDPEGQLRIQRKAIPKNITFECGAEYELIVDMNDILFLNVDKVHRMRYSKRNAPVWLGLRLDSSLFAIGMLLFAPCLLVDYWSLNWRFQHVINFTIAMLAMMTTAAAGVGFLIEGGLKKLNNKTILFPMLVTQTLLVGYFYNWTLEIGFLLGCGIYLPINFVTYADLRSKNHPKTKAMLYLSMLLTILIIDWKTVERTIGSGTLFATFKYNTLLYFIFGLLISLYAVIHYWVRTTVKHQTKLSLKAAIRDYFAFYLASVVMMTLVSPETMQKVIK